MKNRNWNDDIQVTIKARISEESNDYFSEQIQRIEQKEFLKLQESKFILVQMFVQLGKSERVLDYRQKNDIWLNIQPKIKNYIIFKTQESLDNYINNEIDKEKDLYLVFIVLNGKININNNWGNREWLENKIVEIIDEPIINISENIDQNIAKEFK